MCLWRLSLFSVTNESLMDLHLSVKEDSATWVLNINVVKNLITSDMFRHVAYFYIPLDLFVNIVSLFSLFLRT